MSPSHHDLPQILRHLSIKRHELLKGPNTLTSLCSPFFFFLNSLEGSFQSLLTPLSISLSEQEMSCSRPASVCLWGRLQDAPFPFTPTHRLSHQLMIAPGCICPMLQQLAASLIALLLSIIANIKSVFVIYLKHYLQFSPTHSWANTNIYDPFFPSSNHLLFCSSNSLIRQL